MGVIYKAILACSDQGANDVVAIASHALESDDPNVQEIVLKLLDVARRISAQREHLCLATACGLVPWKWAPEGGPPHKSQGGPPAVEPGSARPGLSLCPRCVQPELGSR